MQFGCVCSQAQNGSKGSVAVACSIVLREAMGSACYRPRPPFTTRLARPQCDEPARALLELVGLRAGGDRLAATVGVDAVDRDRGILPLGAERLLPEGHVVPVV